MPILKVGVEAGDAVSGANQAAGALDKVNNAAKQIDSTFKKVNNAVLGLARGFTGFGLALTAVGIGSWLREVVRAEASLLSFSNRTGITVETLSVLDTQARKSGGSIGDFENAITNMARAFDEAASGQENSIQLLGELQITQAQAKEATKSMEQQLYLTAAGLGKLSTATKQASVGSQVFGRSGDAVAASVIKMIQNLPKARQELEALGLVLSRADAVAANNANTAINQLSTGTDRLGAKAATVFVRLFSAIGEAVASEVEGGNTLTAWIDGWNQLDKDAKIAASSISDARKEQERSAQFVGLTKQIQALKDEIDDRVKLRIVVGQTTEERAKEERRVETNVEATKASAAATGIEKDARKALIDQLRDQSRLLKDLNAENARIAQANQLIQGIEDTNSALRDTSQDTEDATENLKVLQLLFGQTAGTIRSFTDALTKAQQKRREQSANQAATNFVKDIQSELSVLRQATQDPVFRDADIARLQTIESFDKETAAIRHLSTQQQDLVRQKRLLLQVDIAERAALEATAAARSAVQGIKDETEFLHLNNEEMQIRIRLREFDRNTTAAAGDPVVRQLREEYEARLRINAALAKTRQLAADVAQALSQGLEDAIFSADSLTDALRSVYLELSKIALRAFITPATNALTGLLSSAFQGAGLFGSRSARGNAFAGGQLIPFAAGGVVTRPTLFPMAHGAGLMGEAGPEAVMPLRSGPRGLSVRSDVMGGLLPIGRIGGDLGVKLFGTGGVIGPLGAGGPAGSRPGMTVHLTQNVHISGDSSGSGAASRKSARQVAGDFRRAIERAGS